MEARSKKTLLGSWFLLGLSVTPHAGAAEPKLGITVQVYNWAHVAPGTLTAAEGEGTRIFREAGVGVLWLNCPLSPSEAKESPICAEPCPWGRFVLRIVSDVPAGFGKTSLGVALRDTGIYASVFYRRVDEFAKEGIATHSQILGHAMAHEIGHLLLGLRGHASFGIMRGQWSVQDLRSASMGAMLFSSKESALIRDAATQELEIPANPKTTLWVTVYVFNSVQLSPRDLIKAETLAARIFEKVGIRIAWKAGLTAGDVDAPSIGEKWNPANLQLRIRKSSTVQGAGVTSEAMGFCLTMEKNDAVILFDEIENRAAMLNVAPAIPLGVTMAHEMGHLLLQSATHSLTGVMKARWLAEDLVAAERGDLTFSQEESRSLRNGMLRRIAAQTR